MGLSDNGIYLPLVSIIVPVYRTASFLPKCIDSILAQSIKNFEVLLIDDGSPDESPAICDEYSRKDTRIRTIHKKNGGVSSARNLGIELSKGQYVTFVDSDDFVDSNYLYDMISKVKEGSAQKENTFVISDYQPFTEDGYEKRRFSPLFIAELAEGGTTVAQFRKLFFDFIIFPPYCKLYRKDILDKKNIQFDTELKSAEDFDFNMRYLNEMDCICYIPSVQYYYRVDYKKYIPSNHGVLGWSEIKSVHIMANGIKSLAKRLGLYDELQEDISRWAANKQYFNRLPMLFAKNRTIGFGERYKLYRELIKDPIYYEAYKRGIKLVQKSKTQLIARRFDWFISWWLFYKLRELSRGEE